MKNMETEKSAERNTACLTILHSNDMHGDFMAEQIDDKLVGGVSLLSGYIKRTREQQPNTVYAVAGDMFKGSIIDSEFKGLSTIEIMNLLSPDVVTLGNHEIDYGIAHLLFIEKCAKFPVINANLFVKTNHARLFSPYCFIERGGLKIMFIGIITEEVLAQTKSEELIGSFVDVREAAQEVGVICDTYKTTDVDYTVLLTHIGFDKDQELASLISSEWGVDLIIGGHTHTLMEKPCIVNGIPIVQAGTGTDIIGRLDLEFDCDARSLISSSWQTLPIDTQDCPKDPVLEEVLDHYKTQTDLKYSRVLTTFVRPLTHPSRIQETELGNLFADMMQADSSFDIMVLGSGSIRKQSMGPVVQLQDLKEVFPFDDSLYMVEVTGAQLRHMIGYVLREEAYGGHTEFYQYSSGVRFVWSRAKGEFEEFSFRGSPISDSDSIKLGLQKYHFANFEDFFNVPIAEIERNKRPRVVASSCFGIYEELFAAANRLDAHVEGRLIIKP